MNAGLKTFLHGAGSVLAIIGLALVGQRIYNQPVALQAIHFNGLQYLSLVGLSAICSLSGWLLAMAWQQILLHLGAPINRSTATRIYGLSQICKYIPGNIFHLAGRQGLGMAAGIPSWTLIKSTAWEMGLLCVTAAPFLLLVAPAYFNLSRMQDAAVAGFSLLLMGITWLIHRALGFHLLFAFLLYLMFLGVSGLVFSGVVAVVSPNRIDAWWSIASYFIIAWLMGLVVPGAPAGMGIREWVLLEMLSTHLSADTALVAVTVGRIVTASGDVVFWFGALVSAQRHRRIASRVAH